MRRTWYGKTPTITVADPDLLKHIMVKDFPHFQDRPRRVYVHFSINIMYVHTEFQFTGLFNLLHCTPLVVSLYSYDLISCQFLVLEEFNF